MPRGLLPPHPCLHTSLHFLLSRTSKAESLAIVSAPPSPFACGGKLNYSRLQRLNKPYRGAHRGAPARVSPARVCSPPLLPLSTCLARHHVPSKGLRRPPCLFTALSRAARSLGEEVMPSSTGMREVMGEEGGEGGHGSEGAGSSEFLRRFGEGKGVEDEIPLPSRHCCLGGRDLL